MSSEKREILYHFAMEDDLLLVLPDYQTEYPELAKELEDLAVDIASSEDRDES